MNPSDQILLRQFVQTRSDQAFDQLVHRHGGLVRDSILRKVRNPSLADDATQAVFLVLAQKAPSLVERPALGGWLLKTARYAAIDALRKESVQMRHERQAARPEAAPATNAPMTGENDPQLAALDDAMASLTTADREALVLRFYQDESFADIAIALGTTEDAARKRTSRALDKLRRLLRRRGTTVSAVALTGLLSAKVQTAASMPVASLTMHLNTFAATSRGASISKGVLIMAANAKLKLLAAVAATALIATLGGALYIGSNSKVPETPLADVEPAPAAPQTPVILAPSTAPAVTVAPIANQGGVLVSVGDPNASTQPGTSTTFTITDAQIKAAMPGATVDANGNLTEGFTVTGDPGQKGQLIIKDPSGNIRTLNIRTLKMQGSGIVAVPPSSISTTPPGAADSKPANLP